MDIGDRRVQIAQQIESMGRDAGHNHTAVAGLAAARNQGAFFEPIEQSGNVRIAGNHALADLTTGQSIGSAAEDAQDVVLSWGNIRLAQDLFHVAGEQLSGAYEAEEGFLLGAAVVAVRFRFGFTGHCRNVTRYNDYCQEEGPRRSSEVRTECAAELCSAGQPGAAVPT